MFALCPDGGADGGEEEDWFSSVQDSLDTSTVSKIVLAVLTGQPGLVYNDSARKLFFRSDRISILVTFLVLGTVHVIRE